MKNLKNSLIVLSRILYKLIFYPDSASYIIFFVTSECDQSCPTCFFKGSSLYRKQIMSPDDIYNHFFKEKGVIYFSLSGGEPFLRNDIYKVLCAVIESAEPLYINIPTNTNEKDRIVRVMEKITEKYKKVNFQLMCSIDDINQSSRIEKSAYINKRLGHIPNLDLKINITANKNNVGNLKQVDSVLKARTGIRSSSITPMHGDSPVKPETIMDNVKILIYTYSGKIDFDCGIFRLLFRYIEKFADIENIRNRIRRKKVISCVAGSRLKVFLPDGSLIRCEQRPRQLKKRPAGRVSCYCEWSCAYLANIIFLPQNWTSLFKFIIKCYIRKNKKIRKRGDL